VPTVRFESEKEISWYDGCQNFEGRYSATENDLTVPSFGVADGYCMKPGVYGEPGERCVIGCFGPEGDYRLRDGLLEIRSEAGETTSILEPMGEEPPQKGNGGSSGTSLRTVRRPRSSGAPRSRSLSTVARCSGRGWPLARPAATITGPPTNTPRATTPLSASSLTTLLAPGVRAPKASGSLPRSSVLAAVGDLGEYPSVSMDGQLELETRDGRSLIFAAPE
jgi:hypothetical protein